MYKNHRVRNLFITGFMVIFLELSGVFGFNLLDEINSKIQKLSNSALSDEYMTRAYSPDFSKDPFGDAVSSELDKYNKPKVAGMQYVKNALEYEGCPLSDKKINGILYYYVDGFKENLARDIKMDIGDYDVTKYELDKKDVIEYCREFFNCRESREYSAWQIFKNTLTCAKKDKNGNCVKDDKGTNYTKDDELRPITKGTSANLETNCKEFFEEKYYEGEYNEQNKLNVQTSQIGMDKYLNNTIEDSPYDIMQDIGELSKLLYSEAQTPISPVFYHVPNFSNSEKALSNGKKSLTSSDDEDLYSDEERKSGTSYFGSSEDGSEGKEKHKNIDGGQVGNLGSFSSNLKSLLRTNGDIDYDDLLEGLGGYRLTSDGSEFYTNLCDNREKSEIGLEVEQEDKLDLNNEFLDADDGSEEEFQEIIDYMLSAVDDYSSLPPEKEGEIDGMDGDRSNIGLESSVEEIEKRINEIKDCYKSCEGLRIDQKASCMVKCTCGEIRSKVFDPKDFPSLGPILIVKYCAVPALDTRFSVGGKRIHSIEEGLNEIYGVVDKLSREGKLGKWTQQYEFLDSSTKRMNLADSFAFTVDVEFVDIMNKMPKHSEQFEKKELKNDNETNQINNGISNPLNTMAGVKKYSIITDSSEAREESLGESTNSVRSDNLQENLSDAEFVSFVSLFEDAYADNHINIESHFDLWLNQQKELWNNAYEYIENLISSANLLNSKNKCK